MAPNEMLLRMFFFFSKKEEELCHRAKLKNTLSHVQYIHVRGQHSNRIISNVQEKLAQTKGTKAERETMNERRMRADNAKKKQII